MHASASVTLPAMGKAGDEAETTALLAAATQALRAGDATAALASARVVLGRAPDYAVALTVASLAQAALGDAASAAEGFQRLTELAPGVAQHWANLGTALRSLRRHAEAAAACDRALAMRPGEASLLYNRALLHADLGEHGAARRLLTLAHRAAPRDVEIRVHLARAHLEAGGEHEARLLLRELPDDLPIAAASLLALAACWTQLGDDARVERALTQALALAPDDGGVHAQLALHAERRNRLDVAEQHLARATALSADPAALHAAQGRLALRRGDAAAARDAFTAALAAAASESLRVQALFELARACDRAGDADGAFAAATRAHAARAAQWLRDDPAAAAAEPELLTVLRDRLSAEDVARWPRSPAAAADDAPVFVVGFPRSGTTLLETMLDAHPALRAMDERPYLQHAITRAFRRGIDYPQGLHALDAAAADDLRGRYLAEAAAVVARAPGQRLVDKNPLNLARLPMIARLWPQARVIVALRDPRDVVLSCFLQHFRNPGIARLCDSLERAASTYVAAFEAFEAMAPLLPLRLHRLRYEDLVARPDERLLALCDFLDLPPAPAMHRPDEHARRRGYISTPSYEQVVEPVHARAVGRWHRYREHFGAALAILAPMLARHGYDAA